MFAQLGIKEDFVTDPALMKDVLKNEMFLGGFEPFVIQIQPYLEHPTSLKPLLSSIQSAIRNKHPAIVEFLSSALENNLFLEANKFSALIERVLYHSFLLENLVQKMSDLTFMLQLQNYFSQLKHERGIRDSWLGEIHDVHHITGSLFQTAKMVTVDKKTIAQYIDFRKRIVLNEHDLSEKNRGLYLNILEAKTSDLYRGFEDNATAAAVLARSPIKKISVFGDDKNGAVLQEFSEGWSSLYETWNLAFVIGNLANVHLVLPKLIIPQVIDATPDEYLYKRGITLWVTTNIFLLNRVAGVKDFPIASQMQKIAAVWGKINLKYAEYFLKSTSDHNIDDYRPGVFWKIFKEVENIFSHA